MPRPTHENWTGFTPLYDTSGNHIISAQCDTCTKVMRKRDSAALKNHKKVCKGPPNSSEVSVNVSVSSKRSPLSALSTATNVNNNKENSTDSLLDDNSAGAVTNTSITPKKTNCQQYSSPPAKSPRLSDNDNKSADTQSSMEKDVYFFKFLLYFNIDFNKINSKHCQNLLNALDSTYRIPSIEDLTGRVLEYAVQKLNDDKIRDFSSTMGMTAIDIDNEIIALSFAIDCNNEYFYIDNIAIQKDKGDYIKKLDMFCNLSVEKAKKIYNMIVKYVLYDGKIRISSTGMANDTKYYIVTTFSQIVYELLYNHAPFLITNSNDTDKVRHYDNVLQSFQKRLTTGTFTLGVATEDLLSLVSDESLTINTSMGQTIIEWLSPVSLAANYFIHSYNGHHFIEQDSLKNIMYDFLYEAIPNEGFDSFSEYKDRTGIFNELNNTQKFNFSCERFWHVAKINHKALSSFTLEIINLPATLRTINILDLAKQNSNLYITRNEKTKAFLYSLILNE